MRAASAFGTIFQGVGYTDEAAAKLSVHFVKLATDLSSLTHIPVEEAMEKIQSGLAGQIRPLREVGVFMTEASVETYAYAHGIAQLGTELTEQQKVQARIGFITQALAKAQGNLALTAGSAANQIRSLAGRFENLKDSIGTALLGFLVPILEDLNVGIQALQMAWERSGLAAGAAAAGVLGGAQAQVQSIGVVQKAIMWAVNAWQHFKIVGVDVAVAIGKAMLTIADALRPAAYLLAGIAGTMQALLTGSIEAGQAISKGIINGFEQGYVKVQDTRRELMKFNEIQKAAAPPSLVIADAFDKARADIDATRKGLAAEPALDPNKIKPVAEAARAGVPKFANAVSAGSQEAANAVLKARYGGAASGDPGKQTAQNTAKTVDLLTRAVGRLDEMAKQKAADFGAMLGGAF